MKSFAIRSSLSAREQLLGRAFYVLGCRALAGLVVLAVLNAFFHAWILWSGWQLPFWESWGIAAVAIFLLIVILSFCRFCRSAAKMMKFLPETLCFRFDAESGRFEQQSEFGFSRIALSQLRQCRLIGGYLFLEFPGPKIVMLARRDFPSAKTLAEFTGMAQRRAKENSREL